MSHPPSRLPAECFRTLGAHDRRRVPRQLYAGWEKIAAGDIGHTTRIAAVQCHDLAASGFSYWTTTPPSGGHVVLSLSDRTDAETVSSRPLVLAAEVRHTTPVTCLAEPLYLVGCRFIG